MVLYRFGEKRCRTKILVSPIRWIAFKNDGRSFVVDNPLATYIIESDTAIMNFDSEKDIGDLSGKVILITGGNAGIGKATVEALAHHNPASIYICARNLETAKALADDVRRSTPDTNIEVLQLDLSSFDSVKSCASAFNSKADRLDIIFLNAGVWNTSPRLSKEGFEIEFAINHMGHALLTQLILPKMLQTKQHDPAADLRIVSTSSIAYRFPPGGKIDLSQMANPNAFGWRPIARYGHSKLANILFIRKLAERYPDIVCTAVHPGAVKSEIFERTRAEGYRLLYWISMPLMMLGGVTTEEGAKTQLWAATAKEVESGRFYVPVGKPVDNAVFHDTEQVDGLWKYTEEELAKHGASGWPSA
ncbi:hypothetical protein D0869_05398 [Hortaea werneckii]|uniref:NAD(P)-binding protein n=1 Tax=Hortaea werneckii TaxID=91943 RepID=A0A3M6WYH2_HORWE|nr:hypothetical protein D0869_05398 [Hortaea werneckii]